MTPVGKKGRLKVEYVPIRSVKPAKGNTRVHPPEQITELARAQAEYGWTRPLLVDEKSELLAGHGNLLAAQERGEAEVPVIVRLGLTPAQKRAYRIWDNKSNEKSAWDYGVLATELRDLSEMGYDLDMTGFDTSSARSILSLLAIKGGHTDPNELPEVPKVTTSQRGDVWAMGAHRLACGDSSLAEDVDRLMAKKLAHIAVTSPPYADQRDYGKKILSWTPLMNGVWDQLVGHVHPTAHILINLGLVHRERRVWRYWDDWITHAEKGGYPIFGWYVWDKGRALPGEWNGRLAPAHEFIFHFVGEPTRGKKWDGRLENTHDFTLHFNPVSDGGRANKHVPTKTGAAEKAQVELLSKTKTTAEMKRLGKRFRQKDGSMKEATSPDKIGQPFKIPDSVIRVVPAYGDSEHPARFSVEFALFMLQTWTAPGELAYEPFAGEGTSIIAAEQSNRSCYAMEIEPSYTDLAVIRWQKFTGKKAVHEKEGKTFEALTKARAGKAKAR